MKDFIPKGTGNSRWMKSSIPTGTTWEEALAMLRAGTFPFDLNGINSAGVAQMGDALNKANLLPDAVGALYGLGSDAVPSRVLEYLGKYAQHWWRRTLLIGQEVKADITVRKQVASYNNREIQYASSISISADGVITLVDPSTVLIAINSNGASKLAGLAPCYITDTYVDSDSVFYVPDGATYGTSTSATVYYSSSSVFLSSSSDIRAKLVSYTTIKGDSDFVVSSNKYEYPHNEIQGDHYYEYLGIPFENAVTAPKIATGSYIGMGTNGINNPNSITADFEIKFVLICAQIGVNNDFFSYPNFDSSYAPYIPCFALSTDYKKSAPIRGGSYNNCFAKMSSDRKTVYWYSTDDARNQYNDSANEFFYILVGQ